MKILLAGPGTGKTTNIKKIIDADYSHAGKIQVISFTNATVEDLTSSFAGRENISCSTLHQFAFRLYPNKDTLVLDSNKDVKLLERVAKRLEIEFSELCRVLGCVTFDAMIGKCLNYVKYNPEAAKELLGDIDLLLVDEYQDFNPNEQALVQYLATVADETIILGDDDQSIYGFKDADPEGIIQIFNDASVEKLEHANICYRCPDSVVDFCTALLKKNKKRVPKTWIKRGNPGEVLFHSFRNSTESDVFIFKKIMQLRAEFPNAGVLVLSPYGDIVETLKGCFLASDVEITDCWNSPIEDAIRRRIWWMNMIFCDNHKMLFYLLLQGHAKKLTSVVLVRAIKAFFDKGGNAVDFFKSINDKFSPDPRMMEYVFNPPTIGEFFDREPEFADDFANKADWGDPETAIGRLNQAMRDDNTFDKMAINFMSIHKSKGLQADFVFICGMTQGILPNYAKYGLDSVEAQRRLLFVGMTRAQKDLYLITHREWDAGNLMPNGVSLQDFFRMPNGKQQGSASQFFVDMELAPTTVAE